MGLAENSFLAPTSDSPQSKRRPDRYASALLCELCDLCGESAAFELTRRLPTSERSPRPCAPRSGAQPAGTRTSEAYFAAECYQILQGIVRLNLRLESQLRGPGELWGLAKVQAAPDTRVVRSQRQIVRIAHLYGADSCSCMFG